MASLKSRTLFLALISAFFCTSLESAEKKDSIPTNNLLQSFQQVLKKKKLPEKYFGIAVSGQKEEKPLVLMRAKQAFNPASLVKIFTASAMLSLLKPSLKFKTEFLSLGEIKNSVLEDHLYLKGGGDPSFVSESLWNLVNHLSRTGLKIVEGGLILDDSRFDQKKRGVRFKTFSDSAYDAPTGALSFNWNTVNIYLRPGQSLNSPLKWHIDPFPSYFAAVKNHSTTKGKRKKLKIYLKSKKNRDSLFLKGQLPLGHKEVLEYKNISFPAFWTGFNAIGFLKEKGIEIKGPLQKGKTPEKALLLARMEGRPLTENIRLMMKHSNNFMVEMLVKNLAVEKTGAPGSLKEGLKHLHQHIQKTLNIPQKEYQLYQASGLNRNNRFTALHILKALQHWDKEALQPDFESTFPLAGEDGTLKHKFTKHPLRGRLYAKTGSLRGVSGLAGFFKTKNQQKIFFVFLFNGPDKYTQKAVELWEEFLDLLQAL